MKRIAYGWYKMKSVKHLAIDEDGRVDFDIVYYNDAYFDDVAEGTIEEHYHTNKAAEGLWEGYDYMNQIVGTCDFMLKQKTMDGKRKAIKRRFKEV